MTALLMSFILLNEITFYLLNYYQNFKSLQNRCLYNESRSNFSLHQESRIFYEDSSVRIQKVFEFNLDWI